MDVVETLEAKYQTLAPDLTERSRQIWAATEALAIGHGGITWVEEATGISCSTIQRGNREIKASDAPEPGRVRHF